MALNTHATGKQEICTRRPSIIFNKISINEPLPAEAIEAAIEECRSFISVLPGNEDMLNKLLVKYARGKIWQRLLS